MYQFPLLLLTEDDVRNSALADMFEDELIDTVKIQKALYDSLMENMPIRSLYDLMEINVIMTKILCDIFRSHMNVLNKELPEIDIWRVKERLKRTLTIIRRKSTDILHTYDDYLFGDTLRKTELWEDNPSVKSSKPYEWNANFLNRISDIHKHMHRLTITIEPRLLVKTQQLKSLENQDDTAVNDYTETINSLPKILEACRGIHKEIKDYVRLIDSL